jgi:hypothetical protein
MTQAIINVSYDEESEYLSHALHMHKHTIPDEFIFSEYAIKTKVDSKKSDMKHRVKLKVKRFPEYHDVEIIQEYVYICTFRIRHTDVGVFDPEIIAKTADKVFNELEKDMHNLARLYSLFIIGFENYVMDKAKERKITTVSPEVVKDHSGKPSKETLSTSRSQTLNLSLEDTIRYVAEYSTTRQYTKHVESFNVRGHYRRYKNGKVVFVKGFVKGDKNKPPKTRNYEM